MQKFTILNVVGARPNMMKMAPLFAEMQQRRQLSPLLVHTGQHYDYEMSQIFLEQLQMPEPDFNLEVGSGSHHLQTAEVMKRFGEVAEKVRPDLIVVVGDVNSTLACALVGAKANIPVAHVEAGLRSHDRSMPEEINRLVTDAVSELLFVTEEDARKNLLREGVQPEKIFFVGNLMIDSLVRALPLARRSPLKSRLGLRPRGYAILTLHRPTNVDDPQRLGPSLQALGNIARSIPIIFPAHPRTVQKILECRSGPDSKAEEMRNPQSEAVGADGIWLTSPASYLDFIGLVDEAAMVITDSGGIQEETTYLGVPCLTYRDNTERPVTVTQGTNYLVGADPAKLLAAAEIALAQVHAERDQQYRPPPLWDGHAAPRTVDRILEFLQNRSR